MHPISVYFSDTQEKFSPELRPENECYRLIAEKPVAGAQFFHFMVKMFIKHVLGVNQDCPGLYGDTATYYATVEQQVQVRCSHPTLLCIPSSQHPRAHHPW